MEVGDKIGRLTIRSIIWNHKGYKVTAVCECGKEVTDNLYRYQIGHRKSCGGNECKLKRQNAESSFRALEADGYVRIKRNGKRIREHRAVMEAHLGRPLLKNEVAHYVNGDKSDNRIENLVVMDAEIHNREPRVSFGKYKYQQLRDEICKLEERIRLLEERLSAVCTN